MLDVVIIGCGIVGASTAYELSRYELSVAVLERGNDVAQGTTKANSAIIHAGYDPQPGTLMAKLNAEGSLRAKELCQKLDVPYKQCGSLVIAFSEEEMDSINTLYERGLKNGVPGIAILDAGQARKIEPALNQSVVGALHAPTAAIISPWEFALALAETAVRNGVELHLSTCVDGITKINGGYRVHTNRGIFESKYVVNAAGVHADTVHNMAARPSYKIIPDRGEYFLLDKSEGNRVSHIIFQCPTKIGKGTLVAPTVHGNLIVGPNNELIDDADDVATTAQGLAHVAQMACKSVPSINLRESIRNFSGVRAASDRDDFIIEEAADAPGFIDLAGIKSPGLSAAPAIAVMAVDLLRGCGLELSEKEEFVDTRKIVRFQELSTDEKMKLIREKPAYGRVICRCVTITEGEILDAIHSPIPPCSLDGVKRRCNAGMGRCQGGFCGPRVLELLSRELNIPPMQVLQDDAGTNILTGETKGGAADV